MSPADDAHLQALKRDGATTVVLSAALFGTVPPLVGIVTLLLPGTHLETRGNPLYWLILAVPLPWVWKLMDYSPGALRTARPMLFLTVALALVVAGWAYAVGAEMTPYSVMIGVTVLCSAAGLIAWPHSLLGREGPGAG